MLGVRATNDGEAARTAQLASGALATFPDSWKESLAIGATSLELVLRSDAGPGLPGTLADARGARGFDLARDIDNGIEDGTTKGGNDPR